MTPLTRCGASLSPYLVMNYRIRHRRRRSVSAATNVRSAVYATIDGVIDRKRQTGPNEHGNNLTITVYTHTCLIRMQRTL